MSCLKTNIEVLSWRLNQFDYLETHVKMNIWVGPDLVFLVGYRISGRIIRHAKPAIAGNPKYLAGWLILNYRISGQTLEMKSIILICQKSSFWYTQIEVKGKYRTPYFLINYKLSNSELNISIWGSFEFLLLTCAAM